MKENSITIVFFLLPLTGNPYQFTVDTCVTYTRDFFTCLTRLTRPTRPTRLARLTRPTRLTRITGPPAFTLSCVYVILQHAAPFKLFLK